jgi:hypothetical protein
MTCAGERRYALAVRVFLIGVVVDLRGGSICLDRLNALLGRGLRLVALAAGNDLPIGRLEVEPKIPSESPPVKRTDNTITREMVCCRALIKQLDNIAGCSMLSQSYDEPAAIQCGPCWDRTSDLPRMKRQEQRSTCRLICFCVSHAAY